MSLFTNTPSSSIRLFFIGSLSVILGGLLSGCRFGNHVETAASTSPFQGYFEMAPSEVKFTVRTRTPKVADPTQFDEATKLTAGLLNKIPGGWDQIFTNPVAFYITDQKAGVAYLVNAQTKAANIVIYTDTNQKLYNLEDPSFVPAWKTDTSCMTKASIEVSGGYSNYPQPKTSPSGLSVNGRIGLHLQFIRRYEGDGCPLVLDHLAKCRLDSSQCDGNNELHDRLQIRYEPYLSANAMTEAEIATARMIAYDITYE